MFLPEMTHQCSFRRIDPCTAVNLATVIHFGFMSFSNVFSFFELLDRFLNALKLLFHLLIDFLGFLELFLQHYNLLVELTILSHRNL